MSTITREWLQQAINDYESVRDELPFGLDDYQGNILAALRIALASLEAEPVAWKVTFTQIDREYNTFTGMYSDKAEVERWVRLHKACNFRAEITPLYAAPSAQVIPDGWISCSERMPDIEAEDINDCYNHWMIWAQIAHADVTNIRIEELKEHQDA